MAHHCCFLNFYSVSWTLCNPALLFLGRDHSDSRIQLLSLLLWPESCRNWKSTVLHVREGGTPDRVPEILITAPAKSEAEGGAGKVEGGRQDFLQNFSWSLKISQQLVIQLFPPPSLVGVSLDQEPPRLAIPQRHGSEGGNLPASLQQWVLLSPVWGWSGCQTCLLLKSKVENDFIFRLKGSKVPRARLHEQPSRT